MVKRCSKCGEEKSVEDFHKSKRDGYQSKCKVCRSLKKPDPLADNGLRQCILCGEIKVLETDFYERKKGSDKYRSQCKPCYTSSSLKTRSTKNLKLRYKNDEKFKLAIILRTRLNAAIRNNQKMGSAVQDLGCSIEELKLYLEKQFTKGMTWDNWTIDGWHIDHIIPLSSFDLTDREQFLKACHYTNLQPLWAVDNYYKHAKVTHD